MSDNGETRPLLGRRQSETASEGGKVKKKPLFTAEICTLVVGFMITLSFSFTQVPLFYAFHLMECDAFYDVHPPYQGQGDRCNVNEITAGTATQYSILGMSTTLCGTLNLFITGWTVKKVGPRMALMVQTFVPAIRAATQILGVAAGKRTGINIIQATQLITILGGPAGYILVINIIAGEVVAPEKRTATFGRLQGCVMLGQGIGLLTGGMIGNALGTRAPFDVAFVSFLVAGTFSRIALPYMPPGLLSSDAKGDKDKAEGPLAPLRMLLPQKVQLADGRVTKYYGVVVLCVGIFLGVLATGYAPLLIQMYATAAFDFDQAANGWLMAEFAFARAGFLIFIFPSVIAFGRRCMSPEARPDSQPPDDPTSPLLESRACPDDVQEPSQSTVAETKQAVPSRQFDLVFLRWSLAVDGALTTVAAFATKRWHIYLAAFLIPFGSGTAPASKGVITEMCDESRRMDALNIVTLIENIARLATQGLFGFIFAAFAATGQAHYTFFCNAVIALCAGGILLFLRLPILLSE